MRVTGLSFSEVTAGMYGALYSGGTTTLYYAVDAVFCNPPSPPSSDGGALPAEAGVFGLLFVIGIGILIIIGGAIVLRRVPAVA